MRKKIQKRDSDGGEVTRIERISERELDVGIRKDRMRRL